MADSLDEEKDEEQASDLTEVYPYAVRLEEGTLFILDMVEFSNKLEAEAFQLTGEGSFFFLKNGEWLSFPVKGTVKKVTSLK